MKDVKIFISQSNYIPWRGYFDAINQADIFVVYDEMQYTKNDWRNRNKIKTKNGVQWITIPVVSDFGQKINQVQITNEKWKSKHWKTLMQNYSKATKFKEIGPVFHELYSSINTTFLTDINLMFVQKICELLQITTKIIRSRDLKFSGDKNERLVDICEQLGGNLYLSGPSAKSYLKQETFENKGIHIEYLDFSGYKEYKQLFGGFDHNVSVLDLLFNEGLNARKYITKEATL